MFASLSAAGIPAELFKKTAVFASLTYNTWNSYQQFFSQPQPAAYSMLSCACCSAETHLAALQEHTRRQPARERAVHQRAPAAEPGGGYLCEAGGRADCQ